MPTTLAPPVALPRGCDLPSSDGEPLESLWHRAAGDLLLACLHWHWRGRTDFFAGANQFFYFDPATARNTHFRGPDFYVVKGVSHEPIRRSWVVWEEGGRVPNVIVELLSESTADEDRGEKRRVYLEQLDVREYYCYDPDGQVLEGWRKGKRRPVAIKPQGGRLWSEELELFVGPWDGEVLTYRDTWLRFFDAAGALVLTPAEAMDTQAQAAEARAQAQAARAQAATAQAGAEADRANTAEAEVAKLRAELDRLKNPPTT
jgi:Uma2 family endonuclease